ncbi:PTS glucose transporter subunit IIA [Actinotalea sp. M2MS4P-6]|uniref:PTS sugar transporter subunit IIA n=1 Tax=Actinotalea sp. M2MS4P-6 TaxID=2983762 RepID=UPI0021E470A7|nr:PTS glucose transporter subunit IIA [Actinotalea sp. M2MS4P-6]MCV2394454.1 PTS glucose transporter subunit IIA [Actinotalea sp. M2MS4P-6]
MTTTQGSTAIDLVAPVSGRAVPLSAVADPAFSSGALGPGIAVIPDDGAVVAPVSGTVVVAMPHAYGLMTDAGVEVLVHIGLDTVRLEGEHFVPRVEQGDRVAAGTLLATVDMDAVAGAGYDTTTIVVVTGWKSARDVVVLPADAVASGDVLVTVVV